MNGTRSLGIGPVGAFMPGEDVMEPTPLVSREMLQAFGPSLLSRMREADTAQQQRWQAGERSPTPMTEDRAWLADDVAGSLLGPMGIMGAIKAYHGSPHRFDRFDMSKIGTGEGAQAYGHGLYFAESPDVATGYKLRESQRHANVALDGRPLLEGRDHWAAQDALEKENWRYRKIFDKFFGETQQGYEPENAFKQMRDWWRNDAEMQKALDEMEPRLARPATPGALYTTRLDVEPEDLLDWDAPLSQQSPNIKKAVTRALGQNEVVELPKGGFVVRLTGKAHSEGLGDTIWATVADTPEDSIKAFQEWFNGATGRDIYQQLAHGTETTVGNRSAAVSDDLKRLGIPGIRYLDQGSRASGDGTRNFVIFDDKLIDIEGVE